VKGFPFALARLKAFFLQFLPKTAADAGSSCAAKAGQHRSRKDAGLEAFGITPTTVEVVVPTYLKRFRPVQQTKRMRLQPKH